MSVTVFMKSLSGQLISDKMLNLYYVEHDLAGAILEALIATPDMNEDTLSAKLYEISAENFGNG